MTALQQTLLVVVGRQAVLHKRTQSFLQDYQPRKVCCYHLAFLAGTLIQFLIYLNDLKMGSQILRTVNSQPTLLPTDEQTATEHSNVANCTATTSLVLYYHYGLARASAHRNSEQLATLSSNK